MARRPVALRRDKIARLRGDAHSRTLSGVTAATFQILVRGSLVHIDTVLSTQTARKR